MDKALTARIAAQTSWGNTTDRAARTAPGRKAAWQRFEEQVRIEHPDLPDDQVAQLAEHRRRAHYLRMAARSAEVRAARKGRRSA